MRLKSANVKKFKSVDDSTSIRIEEDVTALVGKNESGKTAVLQAMYRLNPLTSGHPTGFEELRDYPRRYRSRDKKVIPTVAPVSMEFELDDTDIATFESKFGQGTLVKESDGESPAQSLTVEVSRRYGNQSMFFGPLADEVAMIRGRISNAGLSLPKYEKKTYKDTIAALKESTAEGAKKLGADLEEEDLPRQGQNLLRGLLPKFQYFDEYNMLPGSVSIRRLQGQDEDDLEPDERTALALLRLAGVEQEEFTEAEYESRKAALEAAANQLTDELFEYWTQNDDLSVELDIEFRPVKPASASHVQPPPEPWLQIRVRNQRHRVTLNMSERSKGFVWFFSFLAAFSEFADETRRVILLDEPGLNLHAKAQADLLRYIDEKLAPHHQVIYSTHSLFMIAPDHIERCRTVEDLDNNGTKVSEDVWSARPETVFPLLGALGVEMSQTLIIGGHQLLVEGPADVTYLSIVGQVLQEAGGRGLDPRWTVTPVGGIDKLPTFVALLGSSDLDIAVLMDGASGGNQRLTQLVNRGLLDAKRLIPITDITDSTEADLEDLFEVDWYLSLLDKSGVGKLTASKLKGGGRIVKRVEAALGRPFDHYQPAAWLLRDNTDTVAALSDEAKARFQKLIDRLNVLLP
ncbi:ATP-dependent nuclease [Ornithinimicrobium cerasi]|uniref:ATP-dependent nuclease n=1 Tax=Ornithinimicrobium cerasi TaxID=2248773 RepID=UPI000EFE4A3C|nr:AAA family ATPase [Ornithinimicrobium cerasi]